MRHGRAPRLIAVLLSATALLLGSACGPATTELTDPFEVAEIFEVPFQFLMDGANHQRLAAELPNGRRTFYAMPYQNYFIWGATAGMLRNLFHFLRA